MHYAEKKIIKKKRKKKYKPKAGQYTSLEAGLKHFGDETAVSKELKQFNVYGVFEPLRLRFRFRYHYTATKGLVHSGLPQKSLDSCLVFVFIKPQKQKHARESGSARYFLIYVVCICICVCSFPSKTGVKSKSLVHAVESNTQFRVFSNMFFEEVCLYL